MLMPKRVKRRRVHRGRMSGTAQKGNTVTYGDYGLVAMEPAWITENQMVIGEIINEGNEDALFGFVTLEPLGDSNIVITSYSIHYTKLYETKLTMKQGENCANGYR